MTHPENDSTPPAGTPGYHLGMPSGADRWAPPPASDDASSAPYAIPGMPSPDAGMGGFGDLGGFDLQGLMAQAQAMQSQIANAQAELAAMTFTGTAGGDLVQAVVSGTGELESVTIQPAAVDTDDLESLGDLIVAAVRDAQAQMAAVAASKLGPMAGGMGF